VTITDELTKKQLLGGFFMIEMSEVYKTYPNGVLAINGIDIMINQGEFVYVVGPSVLVSQHL
jgi:cell division transport system ATP-binding protein